MALKPTKRWRSLSLVIGRTERGAEQNMGAQAYVSVPEHGVWAIAEAVAPQANELASKLLSHAQAAIQSGEDLTAAFLLAHGQAQRANPSSQGARLIAIRQTASQGTLELAWVGALSALMMRRGKPVTICTDKASNHSQSKRAGYLFDSKRLDALGTNEKLRPRIDRNLINAQAGDVVLLASSQIDLNAQRELVTSAMKGFGNFEYKLRKLQATFGDKQISGVICALQVT